jgi:hypothetical protein
MSHLDYQAVTFAKEHGIILLTFPPHCSHALQPCDVMYSDLSKEHAEKAKMTGYTCILENAYLSNILRNYQLELFEKPFHLRTSLRGLRRRDF